MEFSGKRFLITQPVMQRINGASVVALQLGEFLKSQGADVEMYTYWHGDPLESACTDAGFVLHDAWDDPQLHLNQHDSIWVHSQPPPQTSTLHKPSVAAAGIPAPPKALRNAPHFVCKIVSITTV